MGIKSANQRRKSSGRNRSSSGIFFDLTHLLCLLVLPCRYKDAVHRVMKDCYEEVFEIVESRKEALWAGVQVGFAE